MLRRTGRPLPQEFADAWYADLFAAFRQDLKPIAGIVDVLRRLAIPKCVASSSAPARLALSLEVTGLAPLCGADVFDASMVSRGKPAPDLFLYCARRMGAVPRRTLVVEDSVTGIAAAVAAGMTAWGFVGGSHYAGEQGYRPVATRRRSADICLDDRIRTRVSSGAAMAWNGDRDEARLDDAARAGWLYYVAGNTQDEIAHKLGISRQSAQRLVSLAISKKLIKVRLDHPIASCMALAEALTKRYDLKYCDVVPSDPSSTSTVLGVAEAAASYLERILRSPTPLVLALGTGRTIRASVNQLPPMALSATQDRVAGRQHCARRVGELLRRDHEDLPIP